MRATRCVQPELRGAIEVQGFELKKGLSLYIYSEVSRDRVRVKSDEFGTEIWGVNVEDGLARMFAKLLGRYIEYRDKEELSQEEECILGRLGQYF